MTKIVITTNEQEENAWAMFLVSKEDMPAVIEYAQKLHCQRRDAVEHCVELSSDKQTCPNCDGEGTGFDEGESWTCSVCDGNGQV